MDEEKIEDATCTDLPQKWGKTGERLHYLFEPVPVTEFCHAPKRKRQTVWSHDDNFSDENLGQIKKMMFEGKAVLYMHYFLEIQKNFLQTHFSNTYFLFQNSFQYLKINGIYTFLSSKPQV